MFVGTQAVMTKQQLTPWPQCSSNPSMMANLTSMLTPLVAAYDVLTSLLSYGNNMLIAGQIWPG